MSIEIDIKKTLPLVRKAWKAKIPVFLLGAKGVGKSSIFTQLAREQGGETYQLPLTQVESVDLRGLPDIKGERTYWKEPEWLCVNDWARRDGIACLNLEEIVSAQPSVQLASMQIMLERSIGQHKLDDKVVLCATGNTNIDNAYIYNLCGPLANRVMILYLKPDYNSFLEYALQTNTIHPMILSYLKVHPEHLHWSYFAKQRKDGSGDTSTEYAEATPRSWEMLSRYLGMGLEGTEESISHDLPAIAGLVGEAVTPPFISHWKTISDLTLPEDIERFPGKAKVPTSMPALYAMCGIIAQNMKKKNADPYWVYINRIPREFQTVIVLSMANRTGPTNDWFGEHAGFTDWGRRNESAILSSINIRKGSK